MSTIHHILRPGGIWVNNGPLVNDYDPDYDSRSLFREWGYEDVRSALKNHGFTIMVCLNFQFRNYSELNFIISEL